MAFNLRTPFGLAAYLRNRAGTVFRRWHARVRPPPSPISDATNRAKTG
jgi:hypothetical protein